MERIEQNGGILINYKNVNFDFDRNNLTGLPEVVLAEPKTTIQLKGVLEESILRLDQVLITRVKEDQIQSIVEFCSLKNLYLEMDQLKRTFILSKTQLQDKSSKYRVAIISAGTSDQYVVEEIRLTLVYFGIETEIFTDAGVAGIHRHQEIIKHINSEPKLKLLIVIAGQDGALFPVLSAQTKLPIIAVPTEVGYGLGGNGVTALYSALQSCSPGIGVVNIGNGFGAACLAYKIFNAFE